MVKMDPNNTDDQKHWSLKVFEDCPIGMALSTADFRFTRVNEALCTMMGYEENELLKLTFKEITHPDHLKEDSENMKRLFNGEIPVYHTEKRYIRKDGSVIWGALKISIISDDTGNFRFFLAMVENITERKHIEMELQRSEKKFKAIFEKSIDAILLTSPDGKIYDVNPQACKLFGMSKEQICTGGRSAILDIADPRLPEAIAERERTGSFYGELTGKKSDGTRFPVEISSVIFFDDSGEQRTSMIMRDLSERNKVEAQLRESEQYLASIYDTVGDVIFVLKVEPDGNYRFDSANKTFTQVTGLSTEQVVGKLVTEVIPEPSLTMVLGKYRQSITEKRVVQWEEISDYPTGKLFGEVKVAPLFDMDGKCTHLVGSVHDITKRKWSENALKESEELYRNLVDKIPDGLYKSTHDGKFVMVNPALVKMLGYDSEEELLSIDIKSQLYFDLSDRESHVLDEHQEEIGVFPLRKKDGSALWVEDHGWYNLDENGEILFHEGIVRDISERIQAEEKRKRSELEYKTLFENANDAIMIMNREKFTECNLMTLKMFGCNCKDDIVDHFPWKFSPELQPDGQLSMDKARGLIEKAMTGEPQRFYWKHHSWTGPFLMPMSP